MKSWINACGLTLALILFARSEIAPALSIGTTAPQTIPSLQTQQR